jgi:hypothetical protein
MDMSESQGGLNPLKKFLQAAIAGHIVVWALAARSLVRGLLNPASACGR